MLLYMQFFPNFRTNFSTPFAICLQNWDECRFFGMNGSSAVCGMDYPLSVEWAIHCLWNGLSTVYCTQFFLFRKLDNHHCVQRCLCSKMPISFVGIFLICCSRSCHQRSYSSGFFCWSTCANQHLQ